MSFAWVICWERQDLDRGQVMLHHRIVETRKAFLACLARRFDAGDTIMGISPNAAVMQGVTREWTRMMALWHHMAASGDALSIEMLPKDDKEWLWKADLAGPATDLPTLLSSTEGQMLYRKTADNITPYTEREFEKIQEMQGIANRIWTGPESVSEKMRKFKEELGFLPDGQDRLCLIIKGLDQVAEQATVVKFELTEDFSDIAPKLDKAIGSLDKILEVAPCAVLA